MMSGEVVFCPADEESYFLNGVLGKAKLEFQRRAAPAAL